MTTVILVLAVSWLAYSNGANDNFKGVATLYGSGTLAYRPALGMATLATIGGSIVSVLLAASLAKAFSGKGLVAPELVQSPQMLIAVGAAAAATVFLATIFGIDTFRSKCSVFAYMLLYCYIRYGLNMCRITG